MRDPQERGQEGAEGRSLSHEEEERRGGEGRPPEEPQEDALDPQINSIPIPQDSKGHEQIPLKIGQNNLPHESRGAR